MSLTVPRAGVEAGRAAQANSMPQAPNPMGEFAARIGDLVYAKGEKIKKERDDLTVQQASLDAALALGQARQEADLINDPVAVGQFWDEKRAQIEADTLANLTPDQQERARLSFQSMADPHTLSVGKRAIELTASQRGAQWIEQSGKIAAAAATADPDTMANLLALGEQFIQGQFEAGDLTPEQAAAERAQFRSDVLTSRAKSEIARDPAAFLANQDAYAELGTTQADLALQAEAELTRRRDAEAKAAEVAAKEQEQAITKALDGVIDITQADAPSVDEKYMATLRENFESYSPETQAKIAQAEAAISLRNEKPAIFRMTPAQLDAEIAAEEAAPKAHPFQVERLRVLRAARDKQETALNTDPAKALTDMGLPVAPLPEIDPADPTAFATALQQRFTLDDWQRDQGYAPNSSAVFSAEDRARLKAVVDPKADVAPKLALVQAFAAQGVDPRKVQGAVASLTDDPVFSRAISAARQGLEPQIIEQMLKGQQMVKLETVSLPPEKQRQLVFADVTGGAYSSDPRMEAEMMQGASALYASRAAGVNPDGGDAVLPWNEDTEAQDMFAQAVAELTGALPDASGKLTVGGLQEINGAKVVLPRGVPQAQVERALDQVTYQLRGMQWNDRLEAWGSPLAPQDPMADKYGYVNEGYAKDADPMRAFKSASIYDGAVPALGPNPAAIMQNAQIRRVGESDVYELVVMRAGRPQVIPMQGDPDGRPYRFRLGDLIKGSQK